MKRFAVIGDPIAHSLSPKLHNFVFQQLGMDAQYTAIKSGEDELPDIIKQLRNGKLNGVNITLPLKQTVLPYLDVIDKQAKAIGAVNCINVDNGKLIGHNTDRIGFNIALQQEKLNIDEKTVIIAGAGGVAKSIAHALLSHNIKDLYIINRSIERSNELIKQFKKHFNKAKIQITKWDLLDRQALQQAVIINCTSVGMVPDINKSPVDKKYLFQSQTIIDTIYVPFQTKLCQLGQSAGAKTYSGMQMFIYQALSSIDIWFCKPISKNIQIDMLQNYLKNVIRKNR